MRFAVIGAAGQLGRDLCPRLPGEVVPLGRPNADLTKPAELASLIGNLKPDVVINCAAYNLVDKAESEPEAAFAVNTWGVRDLARVCQRNNATMVHFSSDYVFGLDHLRNSPYSETDAPGPNSVYSMSKLCGEYAVRAECERHFVIRTCGLYGVWGSGGKGTNFVETMLRIAGQGKPLKVVGDQTCTPSYTVDVADSTIRLLQTNRYGLYHITNAGSMNWHDFAKTIFELANLSANLSPTTTAEYNAAARRPTYSVLSNDKLASIGVEPPRPWRDALKAYLLERAHKPK